MVKTIAWSPLFSVGVKILDDQHKQIVDIINKLAPETDKKLSHDEILAILEDLIEYAKNHFATEEALLKQNNFPDIEGHKEEHDDFLPQVNLFYVQALENDRAVNYELLDFLSVWLTKHILESDMAYRRYFTKVRV